MCIGAIPPNSIVVLKGQQVVNLPSLAQLVLLSVWLKVPYLIGQIIVDNNTVMVQAGLGNNGGNTGGYGS